jgi:hypothetical protein
MVYTLQALHDLNTGIILTTLAVAYLKGRTASHPYLGLAAIIMFIISLLPTPFHGTGILGIGVIVFIYADLFYNWDNKEMRYFLVTAMFVVMINILIGFRLIGYI